MKRKLISLLAVISLVIAICPTALAVAPDQQLERLDAVLQLIESSSLQPVKLDKTHQELAGMLEADPDSFNKVMDDILSSCDSYSMYLPADEYDVAFPATDSYVGVGISLHNTSDGVLINEILENSPAVGSGLMVGDMLTHVDGRDVTGMTHTEIAELIRGEEGTDVTITVLRGGASHSSTIRRGLVGQHNLTGKTITPGVYYMKISRFSDAYTYMLFSQAVDAMKAGDTSCLILDLRGNPGGELNMVTTFINQLIPDDGKEYLTMLSRSGDNYSEGAYVSTGRGLDLDNIIILVDGQSASASEIMASALSDLDYAVTVGQQTRGKARGQSHVVFDDGDVAVLTTVALLPPSGVDYDGVGLTPDVLVENQTSAHPAAACRRLSFRHMAIGAKGVNTNDLMAALKAMGYLDQYYQASTFDSTMLKAVNSFRADMGLDAMSYVNAQTVNLINSRLESLSSLTITVDAQLAAAVEMAVSYVGN